MTMTRRQFTAGLAGAAAGSVVGEAMVAQAARIPPSVVNGILVGVATYTYRLLTFDQIIASLGAVGISSLEIWGDGDAHPLHPARQTEADFRRVRKLLDEAGVGVNAYCTNFRNEVSDDTLERAFVGCALLGAKVLTTSCEKPILDKLDAAARRHRIKVGLHNHWNGDAWFVRSKKDPKANFESPADFEEAMKGRSEYMNVNLDIGHFAAAGYDPVAYFKANHARIVSVHVKDRGADAERTYTGFGKGATPIREVCRAMREAKFAYGANLEYEMDEKDPTEGVRDSFAYVKTALG